MCLEFHECQINGKKNISGWIIDFIFVKTKRWQKDKQKRITDLVGSVSIIYRPYP